MEKLRAANLLKKYILDPITGVSFTLFGICFFPIITENFDKTIKQLNGAKGFESIVSMMPMILYMSMIIGGIKRKFKAMIYVWIISPLGKTYKLPEKLAKRIIRKHDWKMAPVVPIARLTRWQGLKIFFKGNKFLETWK